MARAVSCGAGARFAFIGSIPPAVLALVLFFEPGLERLEVIDDGRCVHLARAGQLLQGVLPRPGRTLRQHGAVLLAGFGAAEDGALVEWTFVPGRITQRLVELK